MPSPNKTQQQADFDLVHKVITKASLLKDEIIVVKIPSLILNDQALMSQFLKNISLLNACDARILLVHDYSDMVETTMDLFGIDKSILSNMHVSDHKYASVVEMVLTGYINKKIVAELCQIGCKAVGISAKDGELIRARQKTKKLASNNVVNFGFVAEPVMVNPELILTLLESNMIVVLSPVAMCDNGSTCLIDTNVTTALIASSLAAKYLVLPAQNPNINADGILLTEDNKKLFKQMHSDLASTPEFKEILDTALSALNNYVDYVCITDASKVDAVVQTIFYGIE